MFAIAMPKGAAAPAKSRSLPEFEVARRILRCILRALHAFLCGPLCLLWLKKKLLTTGDTGEHRGLHSPEWDLRPRLHPNGNQHGQADQRDDVADYTIGCPPKVDAYIVLPGGNGNDEEAGDIGCPRVGGLAVYDDIPRRIVEKAHGNILRHCSVDGEVLFRL